MACSWIPHRASRRRVRLLTVWSALFTAIVAVPAIVAEGWFGLWLLLRSGKDTARVPS